MRQNISRYGFRWRKVSVSVVVFVAAVVMAAWGNCLTVGPLQVTSPLVGGSASDCSTTCESSFCSVAPLLRYGKYCGIGYSGCPGEIPCDGLDACCQAHDSCVQNTGGDYLSQGCNTRLLNCIERLRKSNAPTFAGSTCDINDVTELITHVIQLAILAGRALHKP